MYPQWDSNPYDLNGHEGLNLDWLPISTHGQTKNKLKIKYFENNRNRRLDGLWLQSTPQFQNFGKFELNYQY